MKNIFALLILLFVIGCSPKKDQSEAKKYLGHWQYTGQNTIEISLSNERFYINGPGYIKEIYYNPNDNTFSSSMGKLILSSEDNKLRIEKAHKIIYTCRRIN